MKSNFPIRLKKRRRELNMTVIELGDACGLSHGCISQYENGIRRPDNNNLLRLSSALKVTVDYLIGRSEYGIADLLSDDQMFEVLDGFTQLSAERQNMLFTFFEALQLFEIRKRKSVKLTKDGIPEKLRYKTSW